ncbi:hypothetical protein IJG04_02795 [Candidatus Saccharibacteria bacterium]|nr:hypothetical protein [Candidatus Saccharibacteria bacterium]
MKKTKILLAVLLVAASFLTARSVSAFGDVNITVSPMRESVVLNPGDTYRSSFVVSNPGYSEDVLYYHTVIKPFYVNENYDPVFEGVGDSGQIADWIKITSGGTGELSPNESGAVEFIIEVPEDAPAGGQYAVISAEVDLEPSGEGAINIGEGMGINHVILAEVTGNTIVSGDILDVGIPSFLLGGNVAAYSTIENTGNVHGMATYTMEVSNLFSGEVIYSNKDEEETRYVLPDRTLYNETFWLETPSVGIFNVSYTVEFQGLTSEVSSMVIVCPWWLLFIVVFGLLILIIRIVTLVIMQKKRKVVVNAGHEGDV